MAGEMTGGCQCGRVRYAVQVEDDSAYLCHCRMCQRATGSVAIAFKSVPVAAVRWTATPPDRYASSPFARRGFCRECGTPLTFEMDEHSRMDLTVGSFDDPFGFRPVSHSGVESRHEAWLDTRGLPSERTDQNPRIVAHWMRTIGKLPD